MVEVPTVGKCGDLFKVANSSTSNLSLTVSLLAGLTFNRFKYGKVVLTGLITNFFKSIGWIARVFVRESFSDAVVILGVGL